ncbi:unnamed protein product [Caenorhabditis sp. 36 PRJEB53466]|nr:unnamed protein product [Caenorhabditis sp. 36 PRJEB53466]
MKDISGNLKRQAPEETVNDGRTEEGVQNGLEGIMRENMQEKINIAEKANVEDIMGKIKKSKEKIVEKTHEQDTLALWFQLSRNFPSANKESIFQAAHSDPAMVAHGLEKVIQLETLPENNADEIHREMNSFFVQKMSIGNKEELEDRQEDLGKAAMFEKYRAILESAANDTSILNYALGFVPNRNNNDLMVVRRMNIRSEYDRTLCSDAVKKMNGHLFNQYNAQESDKAFVIANFFGKSPDAIMIQTFVDMQNSQNSSAIPSSPMAFVIGQRAAYAGDYRELLHVEGNAAVVSAFQHIVKMEVNHS